MKIVIPLSLLMLALAACSCVAAPTAAGSATATAGATPTAPAPPAPAGTSTATSPATPAPEDAASPIDLQFSGQVVGRMRHARADRPLCAVPGGSITATLTGDVGGEPVTLGIIVNNVAAGDSQALVVMAPPLTGLAPTPGPYGNDPRSLSSYAGRVAIAPDGRSATMSADLAHGGGPIAVQVKGSWSC